MIFKTNDEEIRKELEQMDPVEAKELAKEFGIEVVEESVAVAVAEEPKGPSRKTIVNMARRSRMAYKSKPKPAPAPKKDVSPFAVLTELEEYKRVMKLRFEAQSKTLKELEKAKDEEIVKRARALTLIMAKTGAPVEPVAVRNLERAALLKEKK